MAAVLPTQSILYVTQVPVMNENKDGGHVVAQNRMNVGSLFGQHLGDTASCGRGGALMIRYVDGSTRNLTLAGGYGIAAQQQVGANSISVRSPAVDWTGQKALFSMVVGAPVSVSDTTPFFWQIYEITNFGQNQTPVIAKVPNQPANANNIMPSYGTSGKILFSSDRPRDGSAHLYPQLEEYLDIPTITGIWSLDPSQGGTFQMLNHSPSGAFGPFVDHTGRVIFSRWDHLSRDVAVVYDRGPKSAVNVLGVTQTDIFTDHTANGTFNYASEAPNAAVLPAADTFPESRNFDKSGNALDSVIVGHPLSAQTFNQFMIWAMNEDGTEEEIVNHAGRHELNGAFNKSFLDDTNLVDLSIGTRKFFGNMVMIHESPLMPGRYFGIDCQEDGTHSAGQIVSLDAGPAVNPEAMAVTYVTHPNKIPLLTPTAGSAVDLYRSPTPMSDGNLMAVHTSAPRTDFNSNANPNTISSAYNFRLKLLQPTGSGASLTWIPDVLLTGSGTTANISYFAGGQTLTFNGTLWELDPVEVVSRFKPNATITSPVKPPEAAVFAQKQLNLQLFQNWLTLQNLSLIISRNVTTRDDIDKQQPFNLKIAHSTTQSVVGSQTPVYLISNLQLFQADQLRGLTTVTGRRVTAAAWHDAVSENPPNPSGPSGSVHLGDDGSMAAIVPAKRALTWQLTDPTHRSVVKERYWVTFQPGEIRTCTSCHGLNDKDQNGLTAPQNSPQALGALLDFWKTNHPYQTWQSATFASVPAVAGDQTDPDFDGLPNLVEYAFNTNPLVSDTSPISCSASPLSVTYHRRISPSGITFHHEASLDLVHWSESATYGSAAAPVADGNGVTETEVWTAAPPPAPATSVFFRIRVTLD